MERIDFIDIDTDKPIFENNIRIHSLSTCPLTGDSIYVNKKRYEVLHRAFEYYDCGVHDATLLLKRIVVVVKEKKLKRK